MRIVRVAVVGLGNVAEKYVSHLQQSAAVELVAVCDPLVDRARSFAQAYGIERTFQDVDQMLHALDFELVVNLTPCRCMPPSIAKHWRREETSGVRSRSPRTSQKRTRCLLLPGSKASAYGAPQRIRLLRPFNSWPRSSPRAPLDESMPLMGSPVPAAHPPDESPRLGTSHPDGQW
jgi:hypothetical protein